MSVMFRDLLSRIQNQELSVEEGLGYLQKAYYESMEFALLDVHRQSRKGFPEVIYCPGKTVDQILAIAERLFLQSEKNILATRGNSEIYDALRGKFPIIEYNSTAKTIVIKKGEQIHRGHILVLSAGTSDIPVAEEAAITAEVMGNKVSRVYDAGIAGLHRLLSHTQLLLEANVVIVVAGMDGALPSVVSGLIASPVIAVPTSVGYGANFGGIAALLTMLNSCSEGVGVVNIDNGFGAGYLASQINLRKITQ